jgi:hypothetical protein
MARPFRVHFAVLSLLLLSLATRSFADPVLGFTEEWPGTSLQGWGGGPSHQFLSNSGTGGVGGAGDGYLRDSSGVSNNYGVFKSGPEYQGNWTAAGIRTVHVWLNDVGDPQNFEIHFAFGIPFNNVWQYNVGFIPPFNQWTEFVVDLTDSTAFTHIIAADGKGYAWALQHNDRILLRHDVAPYVMDPDNIFGDLGLDRLSLQGAAQTGVDGPRAPRALTLRAPQPNPSRGTVAFAIETADALPVRIEIVDVQGRVVQHASLTGGVGARAWQWDGRDTHGRLTAAGVYRVRAFSATGGMSRSFVRLSN